jgi:hypothetical protein
VCVEHDYFILEFTPPQANTTATSGKYNSNSTSGKYNSTSGKYNSHLSIGADGDEQHPAMAEHALCVTVIVSM